MAVVFDLIERIDAAREENLLAGTIGPGNPASHIHTGGNPALYPGDIKNFGAIELERFSVHAILELQRQYAHSDKV